MPNKETYLSFTALDLYQESEIPSITDGRGEAIRAKSRSKDKGENRIIIQKAKLVNDSKIFKKLTSKIWEFRIKSPSKELRLLAFWDNKSNSYVVCTHGFIKKTQKVPKKEINKAKNLMNDYFNSPNKDI